MRHWLAYQVNRRLIEKDSAGKLVRPGGAAAHRWVQDDGNETTIIARGDAFDLYIGKTDVYNVTLTAKTAKELGFWLVWWWVFQTWFGLKHRLWNWSLGAIMDAPNESRTQIADMGQR